jgi:hypothetical protein
MFCSKININLKNRFNANGLKINTLSEISQLISNDFSLDSANLQEFHTFVSRCVALLM